MCRSFLTAAGEDELCEQKPKSLSGFDKLLLPKILRDFPDFNLSKVKGEIADYIKKNLSDKDGLLIHNIVINKYNVTGIEREIVFQAAVQHLVDGKTRCKADLMSAISFHPKNRGTELWPQTAQTAERPSRRRRRGYANTARRPFTTFSVIFGA